MPGVVGAHPCRLDGERRREDKGRKAAHGDRLRERGGAANQRGGG